MPITTENHSLVIDEAVKRCDGQDRLIKPEARFWHMAALVDKYICILVVNIPGLIQKSLVIFLCTPSM